MQIILNSNLRRLLHEPLFPTDPPLFNSPPDQPLFYSPPDQPLSNSPPDPPITSFTANIASPQPRSHERSIDRVAIGVSVSVAALFLVCFSAFLLYGRRLPETKKSTAASVSGKAAVEPDINRSPYRKLNSRRDLEFIHQPSPEIRPLPPLSRQKVELSQSIKSSPNSRLSNSTSSETIISDPFPPPPSPPRPPPPPPVNKEKPALLPVLPTSRRRWGKPLAAEKLFSVEGSEGENDSELNPRIKPLHWDKVRASCDRATVWDQLNSSSFQLNEDAFQSLFCSSVNPVPRGGNRGIVTPPLKREFRVLDPKKSQNIAILLRALNVTWEEVSDALLEGSPEGLGVELLETLVKMAPTKEEEMRLRNYEGDASKMGPAERFLKQLLDIPFAFQRADALLYRVNFPSEVKYLKISFESLQLACEELKNCRVFLKLLDAVLKTGNRMNVGINRGKAKAFKLDTLLKLVEVKGVDQKTTLLHFVVMELLRSEPGVDLRRRALKMASSLNQELTHVKKSATMDSQVLSSYLAKLESGLEKVKMGDSEGKFVDSMKVFLSEAEGEVKRLKSEEKRVLDLVRETAGYFHGDTTREEAHPFRIFVIVKDFLLVLDRVCREIEGMKLEPFDTQGERR